MTANPPSITVDLSRPTPPYEQIRQLIADLINAGTLAPGTRLPAVRQLASDLNLAAGTVARAYTEMETAGLVTTRRGGGTTVAALIEPESARAALLATKASEFVDGIRRVGASDDEALAAINAALAER